MTTPIVQSITDELLDDMDRMIGAPDDLVCLVYARKINELTRRLRAAEKDVDRLNKLDALCEAYGFEGIHEGNRWTIDGPFRDIRAAIDGMDSQP